VKLDVQILEIYLSSHQRVFTKSNFDVKKLRKTFDIRITQVEKWLFEATFPQKKKKKTNQKTSTRRLAFGVNN
jgi:hypothetical protein